MTLLALLKEIRDMGAVGDRVRRVKCGDLEVDLDPPDGGPRQTVSMPLPQEHGIGKSAEEMKLLDELEQRHGFYGASQGAIPSDYVERS